MAVKDLQSQQGALLEKLEKYEQLQKELNKHFSFDLKALNSMPDEQLNALNERTEFLKEAENKAAKDIALLLVYMAKETDQVRIRKAS